MTNVPTMPQPPDLSIGPELDPGEAGVHIIFVPDEVVLAEMGLRAFGAGPAAAATLKHAAKHIGTTITTDIVVFAGQPFHFAKGELHTHPQVHKDHPETILKVYRRRKERVVWWSERPFDIFKIEPETPSADHVRDRDYPFSVKPETITGLASDGKAIFLARSTVPLPLADDREFKIFFRMEGREIDPNMYCDGN
jgi:hypothetical protein